MFFGCRVHVGEGFHHDALQATVNVVFVPEQLLQILNPLEVRNRDPTRIGENVGDYHDPAVVQHGVGIWGSGSVGSFGNDASLDAICVFKGDLIFQRGGNEDVTLEFEYSLAIDGLAVGGIDD